MNFRKAVPADLHAIFGILNLSFDRIFAHFARQSFASLEDAIIAEEGSGIVGAINYRIFEINGKKAGYLFYMAVHPDHRKQGIGGGLIARAVSAIEREAGEVEIYAAIDRKNRPSTKLALSCGFEAVRRDELKKKFGKGRIRLFFQMNLMPWEELFILKPGGLKIHR